MFALEHGHVVANPYVVQQGGSIMDPCWDTLLVGREGLKLPQQVPQPLKFKWSQVYFRPQLSGGGGGFLLFL